MVIVARPAADSIEFLIWRAAITFRDENCQEGIVTRGRLIAARKPTRGDAQGTPAMRARERESGRARAPSIYVASLSV